MRIDYTPRDDFETESGQQYSKEFDEADREIRKLWAEQEAAWKRHTARIRKHRKGVK
jgi:hypothetical protein